MGFFVSAHFSYLGTYNIVLKRVSLFFIILCNNIAFNKPKLRIVMSNKIFTMSSKEVKLINFIKLFL